MIQNPEVSTKLLSATDYYIVQYIASFTRILIPNLYMIHIRAEIIKALIVRSNA